MLSAWAAGCDPDSTHWSALDAATYDASDIAPNDADASCGSLTCEAGSVCLAPCGCDLATDPTCGRCVAPPGPCLDSPTCACLEPLCASEHGTCTSFENRVAQCTCEPPPMDAATGDSGDEDAAPVDGDSATASPCESLPQAACRVRDDCRVRCDPRCGCTCPGDVCGCTTCVGSCFFFAGCETR